MATKITEAVRCTQFGDIWQIMVTSSETTQEASTLSGTVYLATIDKIEEWLEYMPETKESMELLLLQKFKTGWTPGNKEEDHE